MRRGFHLPTSFYLLTTATVRSRQEPAHSQPLFFYARFSVHCLSDNVLSPLTGQFYYHVTSVTVELHSVR
jgi:hypothetical protein